MKNANNKLIILAGLLLLAVLAVRVIPILEDQYKQGLDDIALLESRISRYKKLINDEALLADQQSEIIERIRGFEEGLFVGVNPSLIGSSVQRELRKAVKKSNVDVREMSVSEHFNMAGWLIVSQEMSFTIEQKDMLMFLTLLEASTPRLYITQFKINRSRRQFTGSITVLAFSRLPESDGQG